MKEAKISAVYDNNPIIQCWCPERVTLRRLASTTRRRDARYKSRLTFQFQQLSTLTHIKCPQKWKQPTWKTSSMLKILDQRTRRQSFCSSVMLRRVDY